MKLLKENSKTTEEFVRKLRTIEYTSIFRTGDYELLIEENTITLLRADAEQHGTSRF